MNPPEADSRTSVLMKSSETTSSLRDALFSGSRSMPKWLRIRWEAYLMEAFGYQNAEKTRSTCNWEIHNSCQKGVSSLDMIGTLVLPIRPYDPSEHNSHKKIIIVRTCEFWIKSRRSCFVPCLDMSEAKLHSIKFSETVFITVNLWTEYPSVEESAKWEGVIAWAMRSEARASEQWNFDTKWSE